MILTDDEVLAEKAKYLTTQAKDDPIRFVHDEIGYNFRLTNIQAALGVAQLEQLPDILKRKKKYIIFIKKELKNIDGLSISKVPYYANNNHWINLLDIDSNLNKDCKEEIMIKMEKKWNPNSTCMEIKS